MFTCSSVLVPLMTVYLILVLTCSVILMLMDLIFYLPHLYSLRPLTGFYSSPVPRTGPGKQ